MAMVEKAIPTKKTRLMLVLFVIIWACIERYIGNIGFIEWFEAMKYSIGIYGFTEIGSKASHAYMNKDRNE